MTEEMVRYYASRAPEYDRILDFVPWQTDLAHIGELVARLFRGRRVREVACGTGYWTAQAAAVADDVQASDINEAPLRLARERTAGLINVDVQRADAYAVPPTPATFDAGLAGGWLSHVDLGRMAEFLHAFHSRLEPRAVVLMFDERDHPRRPLPTSRTEASGNRYERRRLDSGDEFEIVKNFFDEARLAALLAPHADGVATEMLRNFWTVTYRRR